MFILSKFNIFDDNLSLCLRPSLLNQKHNVGWFLLRKFVDLLRVSSLHIINRNHSNKLFLLDLQKAKACPMENIPARAIRSVISILTGLDRFLSTT